MGLYLGILFILQLFSLTVFSAVCVIVFLVAIAIVIFQTPKAIREDRARMKRRGERLLLYSFLHEKNYAPYFYKDGFVLEDVDWSRDAKFNRIAAPLAVISMLSVIVFMVVAYG